MKRTWILWAVTIGFVWLVVSRFTEIEKLAETLAQAKWQWVLAAVLLQVLYQVTFAGLYRCAFYTVEVKSRLRDLLPVLFASLFINVAAPGTGAALFLDDAARRGESAAKAGAGAVLVRVADFSTFTLVLIVGLLFLFLHHDLKAYEVVGAGLLLLIIGAWTAVLLVGVSWPVRLRILLRWIQRTANWMASFLRRRPFLGDDWADRNAADFSEAAKAIASHPSRVGSTLAVALAAHLLDLASLYMLFLAFHQAIGFGTLVAGFAIAILFWIVAITPQGIGVVEGVMALAFISLHVPAARAAVITLAFRGLGFWLPLVIGFFLLRRVRSFGVEEHHPGEVWSVRAAALLTGLMGVINVFSAIMPALTYRLVLVEQFWPLGVRHGGRVTAALAGFALLVLASNLWRRKHAAWALTIGVLVISVASHLVKGLDYEEAGLGAALAVWLAFLRPHFHARSDRPSVWQGLRVLLGALAFTLAYGAAGFYLLDRHFSVSFGLLAALRQTVIMFTEFYDPGLEPVTHFGRYFAGSIYVVGAATLAYALLMVIRPVVIRQPATQKERRRAEAIVEAHGRSSLARLALMDDKSYYFSPGGSVVAFSVRGRTAVALGDPIGPEEDAAATIIGFEVHCSRNDWQPAFYQTLPDYLEHYRTAGFQALCIGHEAIVDVAAFTLAGKAGRPLRTPVNRLTKLGYKAEVHDPPLTDAFLRELQMVSDEWLTMARGTEKRFSLGWFDDRYIRSAPVMALHSPRGEITAFANIVPEYQLNETTIDLMRHRRQVEHGTMDFLFVALLQWAKEQGFATFNLGLSPLAGIGEKPDDPMAEKALRYVYQRVNRFYGFKGLHEFKAKFSPRWSPRYLIYRGTAGLPAIWTAILRASSGDLFVWDYLKR